MAQGSLGRVDWRAPIKGMESVGRAQPVRGYGTLYPRPGRRSLDNSMHLGRREMALTLAGDEDRGILPAPQPP